MKQHARDLPCKSDDCAALVGRSGARGMCQKHYLRWKAAGGLVGVKPPTASERFLAKVEKTEGCWTWVGAISTNGYGKFFYKNRGEYAHRASWDMSHGPIPKGMLIDHTCFNHACVNPDHLRLVTQKQNQENRAGQRSDNTSGYRGVMWKNGAWSVHVHHNGKDHYIGRYSDREAANEAAIEARNQIFTHNELDRTQKKAA